MYRYTTPTLQFKLPVKADRFQKIFVTITQGDNLIEKDINDLQQEDNIVKAFLTQDETGLLESGSNCYIQLRAKDFQGNSFASRVFQVPVDRILKEGAI